MNKELETYKVTYVFIAIVCIVYVFTSLIYSPDMNVAQGIEAGGFNPILVLEYGQWYRLITANFIHFGIMHIFCNTYSLYNLRIMEQILGWKRYLAVMIVSTLSTTVLPLFAYIITGYGANSIAGGISGALFGLLGSIVALAWTLKGNYTQLFKAVAPSLVLMLVLSFAMPSISLSGHISGFIGGFITTLIIIKLFPLPQWKYNIVN
ncbi:MAG: rhomboid family intramembrane serine protease [Thomasclavelia sp.]|nr:rhomboid family intramembrane serine protease [Thomasclavelia sp.]